MTAPFTADALVVETTERLLGDICTPESVEQAEATGWSSRVWDALVEAGFPWVSIPAEHGGSGGTLADAAAILRSVGRHAAPVPLAETGVLASWLLTGAGLTLPGGPTTVVSDCQSVTLDGDRLTGSASVAWAERSERVVVLIRRRSDWLVASCRPDQLSITPATNLGGEPRDLVHFDLSLALTDHGAAGTGVDGRALLLRGAWTRIAMAAGALEAISQMTIDYTHERQQFGRPVATFQAVQQHLVTVTQCAVRATMAAQLATMAMIRHQDGIDIAAARVIVDNAIALGTRAAHQAHGAMGVTREYPLHQLTRRLWAWRHEYGSTSFWRRQLGRQVVDNGADDLFALITG
jgi:acyl-CoA dehydrogenase